MSNLGAAGIALVLPGCCIRGFPNPQIPVNDNRLIETKISFLRPRPISKSVTGSNYCVDAHAHFFNASDVTVSGYLGGPVAHSYGGIEGMLLSLLSPFAEDLAMLAPTAINENNRLDEIGERIRNMSAEDAKKALEDEMDSHRRQQSQLFFQILTKGKKSEFQTQYELEQKKRKLKPHALFQTPLEFNEESLYRAMKQGETPRPQGLRMEMQKLGPNTYPEGALAFVGYMLNYRWVNLRVYQSAYSSNEQSIGVDTVLGALVDFDRWLDCPPRSAHEDQMRLHAKLSKLSGGYMLPIMSYNPWTDVVESGRSLELLEEAVKNYGFVGAKIYPPNGFRPWGNTSAQGGWRLPDPQKINQALKKFWDLCLTLDIPVMAHAGPSMGKDKNHDLLGGPEAWSELIEAYAKEGKSPRANLGHFGGEGNGSTSNWTSGFIEEVMKVPHGDRVYADTAFWDWLQCDIAGSDKCEPAISRLIEALQTSLGSSRKVADRILYGSDWFMLSSQQNWNEYASDVYKIIKDKMPDYAEKIFGKNATDCFPRLLNNVQ